MTDDGRLSILITHSDGRVTRLGPDEVDAANVPMSLTFSSSLPGGFKDCSLQLLVRIDLETPIELLDDISVIGPGGDIAWEGRITQLPRSHGDSFGITPGAVGWSAHLSDDPSFREIYVDRDPGSWTEATLTRKRISASVGAPQGKVPVSIGAGGITWLPPNESLPTAERTEVMYDPGSGLEVAGFMYRGQRTGAFTNFEAANLYTDDNAGLLSPTGTALTLDNTVRSATPTVQRYGMLRTSVVTTTTPAAGHEQSFDLVAVYGNHGVTRRTVTGDADGLYASDVITNILARAAPELTYTTGADGSIQPTAFPIPHLVFKEPVAAEDAILTANAWHQWEWGVFEGREFFYRPTDPDRCLWEARLSEGAHLDLEGQTAGDTYNGVIGSYTDPFGQRKTFGPPGSNADVTSSLLEDTSDDNPANRRGIRKWGPKGGLNLTQIATDASAVILAAAWFSEQAIPQRRGAVKVTGQIRHSTRGMRPTWAVRAGDYVRIADHPTDVPRRIIETSYDHSSRTVTMNVGTQIDKVSAILERLNVASIGRY